MIEKLFTMSFKKWKNMYFNVMHMFKIEIQLIRMFRKKSHIDKNNLQEHDGTFMCNLGQVYLWLRNQKFIEEWFKKYGESDQMQEVKKDSDHIFFHEK